MKKTLLKKLFLFTFILGVYQMNAQADIEYNFDTNWDGWTGGAASGAWASTLLHVSGTAPNTGLVKVTYPADTKNAVMYNGATLDADAYKFIRITIKNESTQCNQFKVRGKIDDTTWKQHIFTITTGDTDFKTYEFELDNDAAWKGTALTNQIIFRKSDGTVITDGGTIYVDQVVYSTASTLGVEDYQQLEGVNIFPNPAADKISIVCPEGSTVGIYSLLGVKVRSVEKAPKSFNMDISGLAKGLYIVKVESEGKFYSKKTQIK